jgi:hypothetical protein
MGILENAKIGRNSKSHRPLRRLVRGVALLAAGLLAAAVMSPIVRAGDPHLHRLAVLPFEIKDTSGEVGPADRHEAMLARLTDFVGKRIATAGLFDVLDQARVDKAVAAANPGTYLRACNGCELDIAKSVGANAVMIGWFYKVSTLIGTLHVVVKDVATGKVIYAHVFDFRGDNDKAWERAADYMVDALARSTKRETKPTN